MPFDFNSLVFVSRNGRYKIEIGIAMKKKEKKKETLIDVNNGESATMSPCT